MAIFCDRRSRRSNHPLYLVHPIILALRGSSSRKSWRVSRLNHASRRYHGSPSLDLREKEKIRVGKRNVVVRSRPAGNNPGSTSRMKPSSQAWPRPNVSPTLDGVAWQSVFFGRSINERKLHRDARAVRRPFVYLRSLRLIVPDARRERERERERRKEIERASAPHLTADFQRLFFSHDSEKPSVSFLSSFFPPSTEKIPGPDSLSRVRDVNRGLKIAGDNSWTVSMNFDATHFFFFPAVLLSSKTKHETHTAHETKHARRTTRREPHQLRITADSRTDTDTDSCARSSPAADFTQYRSIRDRECILEDRVHIWCCDLTIVYFKYLSETVLELFLIFELWK